MHKIYSLFKLKVNIKRFASSVSLCQISFESLYVPLCSSTMATLQKQLTNRFYFVVFNQVLLLQFSSHLLFIFVYLLYV